MAARLQETTDLLSNIMWTGEGSMRLSSTGSVNRICVLNVSGSYEAALFIDQDTTNVLSGTLVYSSSDSTGDTGFNSAVFPFFNGKRWYFAGGVVSGSNGYDEYLYFGEQYENVGEASASFVLGSATTSFINTRGAFGNNTEIVIGTGLGSFDTAYGWGRYTEYKFWNNCPGTSSMINRVYDVHDYSCDYISKRNSQMVVHLLGTEDITANSAGKFFVKNKSLTNDAPVFTGSSTETSQLISSRFGTINYFSDVEVPGNIEKVRIHNDSKLKKRTVDFAAAGIEISPASSINKDIMRHLPSIESINDYVGKGIERYRDDYRELEIARNTVFDRYREEGVDINTFFDACNFLDMRFVDLFRQFIPANIKFLGAEKTVESHALERNKIGYRYSVYHTAPTMSDNAISASAIISGNVCSSNSGDVGCSGSTDGYRQKEQIDMFHNVFGGKMEKADCTFNKDVQFLNERKTRNIMRSQRRPNLPTTMYESVYDNSIKSPNDIVCLNNKLTDYEMKLLNNMNSLPFHRTEEKYGDIVPIDAGRKDVFVEQGYQHYRDHGYYGGNSGIQSFEAGGLPVQMHNDIVWHRSGAISILSGSMTGSSAYVDNIFIGGLSPRGWGELGLRAAANTHLGRLTKARLVRGAAGQILYLNGRRSNFWSGTAITSSVLMFGTEEETDPVFEMFDDTINGTFLQFLFDDGVEEDAAFTYDLKFHFDRAIPHQSIVSLGSNDLNGLHNCYGSLGRWCGDQTGTQAAGEVSEFHWYDKYDSMYNSQKMNLMNFSFGRKVLFNAGTIAPVDLYQTIFGKYWDGVRVTPWLGWGAGIQSYYENQLMNGKREGAIGHDKTDPNLAVSVSYVGSKVHCAWPNQEKEYVVKRHPLQYDGFYVGEGYRPGIMKESWQEGYDINVKEYDSAIVFMYCAISGTASSDGFIRVETKFKVAPTENLPFVDETVTYASDRTGGIDYSVGHGTFGTLANRSFDNAYYLGQYDLIYRKEIWYDKDDPNLNDASWIVKKDLSGIGKIKMLTRAYTNPAAGVFPPDTSLLAIIHLIKDDEDDGDPRRRKIKKKTSISQGGSPGEPIVAGGIVGLSDGTATGEPPAPPPAGGGGGTGDMETWYDGEPLVWDD